MRIRIQMTKMNADPDPASLPETAWLFQTKKMKHTLEGHAMPIRSLAFSPDSQKLLTGWLVDWWIDGLIDWSIANIFQMEIFLFNIVFIRHASSAAPQCRRMLGFETVTFETLALAVECSNNSAKAHPPLS
jgi:hypothetical protein